MHTYMYIQTITSFRVLTVIIPRYVEMLHTTTSTVLCTTVTYTSKTNSYVLHRTCVTVKHLLHVFDRYEQIVKKTNMFLFQ